MFQLKRRKDSTRGWRFMVTICFYQDSRHETPLYWIRRKLGIGYLSRRNDGITEIRINGYRQVKMILARLLPFLKFKKLQATTIYRACELLARKKVVTLTKPDREFLLRCLVSVQKHNYASRSKKSLSELRKVVGLTP